MGNIKNYNFNRLDLKLSNSDYWDFFLAADESSLISPNGLSSGDCFVVWYDFNNPEIYSSGDTGIYSLVSWDNAVNTGYTCNTIGLTGIDNGLITFIKSDIDTSNQALLSAITGSTLVISSGDTRLSLRQVTGTTGNYVYPINKVIDPTFTVGNNVQLCGGFYQGYYKLDGNSYEILPTRVNHAWSAEFWLNPQISCSGETGTTLNDTYPNNKGFFFYLGTRAENKFWTQFSGNSSGCTSGCTQPSGCTDTLGEWCTVPKEIDITLIGDYGVGIPLSPPQIETELITNNFLIYGRSSNEDQARFSGDTGSFIINETITGDTIVNCSGCQGNHDGLGSQTVRSYDGKGIIVAKTKDILTNTQNPFLVYGRANKNGSGGFCCGSSDGLGNETSYSFSGFSSPQVELDYKVDIIDNAIGFRIKDDGSIGYRLLTVTGECQTNISGEKTYISGVTIQEGYSEPNMVLNDDWSYISIRFVTNFLEDCNLYTAKQRVGKLMFYVNARLKYVVEEFPEFIAKRLNENKLKQIGVPFNISLGGGSQGLIESQTFDGQDLSDLGLPIETNFAGTFIGSISQFKFNICDLPFSDIQYTYITERTRYGIKDTNLMLSEDGYLILQENGYGIE